MAGLLFKAQFSAHILDYVEKTLLQPHFRMVQDRILRLPGRAELPLCPEFLGGAAAPPYRRDEEFSRAPTSAWWAGLRRKAAKKRILLCQFRSEGGADGKKAGESS
jgi:hypothetical protein